MHVKFCVSVVVLLVVLPTEAANKCGKCKAGLRWRRCKPCPPLHGTQDKVTTMSLHQLSSESLLQTSFYISDGRSLESWAHVLTRTTAELVFSGKGTPTLKSGIPTSSPWSTSSSTQWSSEISLGTSFSSFEWVFSTATHFNDVASVNTYSSDVGRTLRDCELDCTFKRHNRPVLRWTMLDSKNYHMRVQCAEWCGRLEDCSYFVYSADSEICHVYASDGTQSSNSKMMIWIKVHC
ncbi:uncharacterized protein [Haliotis asinina]|uniref:uncharacterized protein n=1 Tax=Haliotis asinina TaxID=109174 RepID=UPI003531D1B6